MFKNKLQVGKIYSVRDKYGSVSFDAEFVGLIQNSYHKELLLFETIRGRTDKDYYRYCGAEARSHFQYRQDILVTELWVVKYGHDKHLNNSEPKEDHWELLK